MPPCRRVRSNPYLMSERRLQLLEQIWARHEARIATGLPPNAVDPVEEEEEEDAEQGKELEEDMGNVGDADLQAEQQVVLDSLWSESKAEASCRRLQEAEHVADVDEMLGYMDEEELKPSYIPIYLAPGTNVVDISGDEA
nr:uncharacterized protein LOC109739934 [Aegilops tauschii subsp. strangulata]